MEKQLQFFSKHTDEYLKHLESMRDDETRTRKDREAIAVAIFNIKIYQDRDKAKFERQFRGNG